MPKVNPKTLQKLMRRVEGAKDPELKRVASLELFRQCCFYDFFFFAKYFLGYRDLERETHGQFIQVFEANSPRKIVVMPRGTFKSTLGSVAYPIWRILKNQTITILLDSELYSNSKNFIREIKGHFQSEKMRTYFGDFVGPTWGEGEIIVNRPEFRPDGRPTPKEATVTAGGLGTTKVGQHYDLIIGDDYNSPQNSETPEKCQKVIDHVRYNLNILNPSGEYLFIGTRYAERDVIGFFLKDVLAERYLAEGILKLADAPRLNSSKTEDEFLIEDAS